MGRLRSVLFLSLLFLFLGGLWTQVRLEEIDEAYPFPPGKNAKLVKQVCGRCHTAETIYMRSYDEKEVRRHYELMVNDPDPEREEKVIEYLCTVLGFK